MAPRNLPDAPRKALEQRERQDGEYRNEPRPGEIETGEELITELTRDRLRHFHLRTRCCRGIALGGFVEARSVELHIDWRGPLAEAPDPEADAVEQAGAHAQISPPHFVALEVNRPPAGLGRLAPVQRNGRGAVEAWFAGFACPRFGAVDDRNAYLRAAEQAQQFGQFDDRLAQVLPALLLADAMDEQQANGFGAGLSGH